MRQHIQAWEKPGRKVSRQPWNVLGGGEGGRRSLLSRAQLVLVRLGTVLATRPPYQFPGVTVGGGSGSREQQEAGCEDVTTGWKGRNKLRAEVPAGTPGLWGFCLPDLT